MNSVPDTRAMGEWQFIVSSSMRCLTPNGPPTTPLKSLGHCDLELNCVIFGDHHDAGKVFSVEISNTKPISALKDAIKDKQQLTLRDIEANALKLWKVSVPVDDNFMENVQELDLKDKHSLSSVDRLSICFSDNVVDGHVHIIVLASPFCECN